MTFQEFCKEMKTHFKITNGVQSFVDYVSTSVNKNKGIVLNILVLDDWLHEQLGDYEEKLKLSMAGVIEKQYGKAAVNFVENTMVLKQSIRKIRKRLE